MNAPGAPRERPLRLVQVGLGGWGRDWLHVLRESAAQGAAFVDADPAALHLAREAGVPADRCFTSLESALSTVQADAALVTTGVDAHFPVAQAALQAGLHVLVEKPFAATLTQAQQLVQLAHERHLTLMVSQNYRFHPGPRRARELLTEERLGAPGYVELDFRRDRARGVAPGGHHQLPHPLLLDMAIHHFDLLRFVLNREPLSVDCRAFNPAWSPFRDPASAVAILEFGGGVIVRYSGSWVSSGPPTPWSGEWRVECEHGELLWSSRADSRPDRVALRPAGQRARAVPLAPLARLDRAGALAAFRAAVHGGAEPESSGRDNVASLALCHAALRSAEEGRRVPLSELLPDPQEAS